jgi:hypothetical protein
MSRGGALLLQLVKDQVLERRIDVETALDLRGAFSVKKLSTTSSPGDDARRWRAYDGTPRLTRMFGTKPGLIVQLVASLRLRNFISSS